MKSATTTRAATTTVPRAKFNAHSAETNYPFHRPLRPLHWMVRAVHFLALAALLALVGAPPPPLIANAAVKGSAAAGGPPPAPCSAAPDCATAQYCDNRNECYDCTFLAYGKCDAIDEDCCSAAFLKQCPNDPMKASCQEARCTAALETECGANKSNVFDCANCAGRNEQKLHAAGCNNNDISVWCGGGAPTPGVAVLSRLRNPRQRDGRVAERLDGVRAHPELDDVLLLFYKRFEDRRRVPPALRPA